MVCVGEDVWEIDDLRTWRDSEGTEKDPVMPDTGGLYLQVRDSCFSFKSETCRILTISNL